MSFISMCDLTQTAGGLMGLDLSATAGTAVSYDSSTATAALTAGTYAVCASTVCHIKTGPVASVTATTNCFRLPADTIVGVVIDATNTAIAAIKNTTAGSLTYIKVQ